MARITQSDQPCEGCGRWLVPQRSWDKMPPAERAEARADGFNKQGRGQLCSNCYQASRRACRPAAGA